MSGKCGKHAPRNTAVTIDFARAKDGVRFIHHNNDWSESANSHENAHLLALGVADPFRAEFAHFHDRQSAFAGEAINEKRFSYADSSRHQHPALDNVGLAVFDQPGQFPQLFLCGHMCGDDVESHAGFGIFETDQTLAIFLNEALLAFSNEVLSDASAIANCFGQKMPDAQ